MHRAACANETDDQIELAFYHTLINLLEIISTYERKEKTFHCFN